jgi:hypothetical protein
MAVSRRKTGLRCLLLLAPLMVPVAVRSQSAVAANPNAETTQQQKLAYEASNFAHARDVADNVLRGPDFQRDLPSSWWEKKKEQLTRTLGRFFSRVSRFTHAAPWLAKAVEWLCFGGAAVGLLLFILRELRRQRLSVSLGHGQTAAVAWTREADDWASRAEAFAREGQWRNAVHCLYWAAIVLLEGRRAWKHNPTRTPREYVRLLRAGSPQQKGLRGLTQIFERAWYGHHETSAAEYNEARGLYDGLNVSSGLSASLKAEPLQTEGAQA